jgi:glycosyltransferase involved in cell wall biosynthesis
LEAIVAEQTAVLLLIPRLNAGGAEQVMTLLARGLSREKYRVHLGLVTADTASKDALPEWVTAHALGAKRARWAGARLLRLVWRIRPAVILSGAAEISFMVLLLRQFFPWRTKVLVRQNGTVSAALKMGGVPGYTRMLYRWLYGRADWVICQTRSMAEDLAREAGIGRKKLVVLANPVDVERIRAAKSVEDAWSGPGPHLLAVGRLSHEKGYDLLIDAMERVREVFPDAELVIAGAGPGEAALKQMSRERDLQSAVRFVGRVTEPYGYFEGATLFVQPSRYEGMPNALLEAAAAGLPLVATPASGGVVDLLQGRAGAWLAKEISAESLAEALIGALGALETSGPGRRRFDHAMFTRDGSPVEQASAATIRRHGPGGANLH